MNFLYDYNPESGFVNRVAVEVGQHAVGHVKGEFCQSVVFGFSGGFEPELKAGLGPDTA
ncbi:MAG: hypothetical protein ABIK38_04485 [candidate division WOR-3 bacterium]